MQRQKWKRIFCSILALVLTISFIGGTQAFAVTNSTGFAPKVQYFFNNPLSMAVDSAGNVYVVDAGNSQIQKFNSAGTFLTKWGTSGSGDGQFKAPRGIAVDSAGNVYVADLGNFRIQKFSSTGTFITKWGSNGTGDGQFISVTGVAVDGLGNVYVTDNGSNQIQKFSSTGTFVKKWGGTGTGDGQFKNPVGIAVDSTGNVYVSEIGNHRIQKFSSTGIFDTQWGEYGTGNGQFDTPFGIAVDSAGNVYVADTNNKRIQKFSSTGVFDTKWGTSGSGDGQFNNPYGIAADSAGNVYVCDNISKQIQKFDATGAFLASWAASGSGDGYFNNPKGVAVDSTGNIYVVDAGNNRVQKFDSTGAFITKWGTFGSGDGQFNSPSDIAVDSAGNVYVTDSLNNRIQKFSSTGDFITKWGTSGGEDGQFVSPRGAAVDSTGNLYVVDMGNSRIQKFSSKGDFIIKWGTNGSGDGQFNSVYGVTVDDLGNVYAADASNHRIQKFSSTGVFLAKWGGYGSGDGQFAMPYGVAADSWGNVYVVDTANNRIQKFDSTGVFITKWGTSGKGDSQFNFPYDIAADSAGNVYVADSSNNRIQVATFTNNDVRLTSVLGQAINAGPEAGTSTAPKAASINVANSTATVASGDIIKRDTGATVTFYGTDGSFTTPETGSVSLTAGEATTVYITVRAQDMTVRHYAVTINRVALPVYISAATVIIAAPTAGASPQTAAAVEAATSNEDYTVSNVVWNEALTADGKFRAGQVYTATVTLTSKNGKEFQTAAFTPAVAGTSSVGATTTAGTGIGNTVSFTVTFNATAAQSVTAITVETQPTKLTYTAGETLDLTGLVATLTYNDGSTLDVALANFAANGITVNPANGTVMSVAAHNGTPVTLTCNSHTVTIGNLAVNEAPTYAITLSETGIRTFTEQTVGYTPVAPITVTVTRTGTENITNLAAALSGADSDSFTLGALEAVTLDSATTSTTFTIKPKDALAPKDYTAVVTVTADNGVSQSFIIRFRVNAPSAPTIQSAAAGDGHVKITWSSVPGATGYDIYKSTISGSYGTTPLATVSDSVYYSATVTGSVYSYVATGLTNGITYYFVIKAANSGGDSASSNEVSAVPRTVPGVPTGVTAVPGNGEATISFMAPSYNGGSPITEYIVTSNPGGIWATGTGTSITVTGLSNGTTYTFTVEAVNAAGKSTGSAVSNAVTPVAPSRGGGSSTNQPSASLPSNTGVDVLVNGKPENAGTATTTTQGSQTVTTITVDAQKLQQKLESEGNKAVVTIPVHAESDVIIGELNAQMVKNMESKEAVLEIRTETATYTIPAQQINIDAVSESIGKEVDLQSIKVQVAIVKSPEETVKVLENSAQKGSFSIVAPPIDFSIMGSYGDKTVEVSKFNAYVERMVAIPEGVDPNKITTGIVMELDGTVRHIPTQVTIINGRYYAKINSLTNSTYSVVWHPLEFKDAVNHWAKEAVNDMGSRMVISGVGDGIFQPDRDITRAEFAAIVVRALGLKPGIGIENFIDVQDSDWYSGYIKTAYEYKIVSGYNADTFGSNDSITREQAMAMIARAMKITPLKVELAESEIRKLLGDFDDGEKSEAYAKSSIAACIKTGVVMGKPDNMLAPKENITRAEVAVIVRRMLKKANLI